MCIVLNNDRIEVNTMQIAQTFIQITKKDYPVLSWVGGGVIILSQKPLHQNLLKFQVSLKELNGT